MGGMSTTIVAETWRHLQGQRLLQLPVWGSKLAAVPVWVAAGALAAAAAEDSAYQVGAVVTTAAGVVRAETRNGGGCGGNGCRSFLG